MAEQNWPGSHIAGMLRDYATLRQQAGRVDEGMVSRFKAAFAEHSTISPEYDGCIRAGIEAALAQNTQGEAVVGYITADNLALLKQDDGSAFGHSTAPIYSRARSEREIPLYAGHAERARVPDGWVPRAVAEVAQGDLHMLKKAIEARDPWPELLVRVNDTERDLRTALAAAPSQRAEVKAEERAVGVCGCGMAGIMVERNGERVCSDCRPADRVEVK